MIIKDCLFGQVRKLGGKYKNLQCTDLPNDTNCVITKQEVITWDDATGMNPLCDYLNEVPNITINKMSYGCMLEQTYDMGAPCVTTLSDKLLPAEYEALIREDYTNRFAAACKRLGQWWHIHHFLNRPDALDYDFTIVRQIDTVIESFVNQEEILKELTERANTLFQTKTYPATIPMIYDMGADEDRMDHVGGLITWSHAFVLNRATVKILRNNFYRLALYEANRYFELIGENNYTMGLPTPVLFRLAIKQEIEMLSMPRLVQHPTVVRGQGKPICEDYARIDRAGI